MRRFLSKLWNMAYGGFILLVLTAVGVLYGFFWAACHEASRIASIESPVERGLCYVAFAIVLHAFWCAPTRGKD